METFDAREGPALSGGRMASSADSVLVLPHNLGAHLKEVSAP